MKEEEAGQTEMSTEVDEGAAPATIQEVEEDEAAGPLYPPPPSFRGATRGGRDRPLSQSVPQVSHSCCLFCRFIFLCSLPFSLRQGNFFVY